MSRSIRKNFSYNFAYQVLSIVTPLVTAPYLSRVLGADGVGTYSYTYSITNYFVMFATLGMSTYGVRLIASCGDDRGQRSKDFCEAYCSQLIVGGFVVVAYAVYAAFFAVVPGTITLVWGLWVLSAVVDVSWLLFGVEEFKIPTIRSMVTKILSLVVIFVFVHGERDLWIYVLAIAGSFFVNQALIWPFVNRYVDFVKPRMRPIFVHFRGNARLFLPVVAISLYGSFDKLMLGSMSGMAQTGYYEYAEKIISIPLGLVTALGTVMLPRMADTLNNGKRSEGLELLDMSMWVMLAASFATAFGIAAIAPEFVIVYLGEGFNGSELLIMVLAITVPLIAGSNVLGRQYLLPSGRDNSYTASVCFGAVVNVALNFIAIPHFAAFGASVTTVVAEVAVLGFQCICIKRDLPLVRYVKNCLPFGVAGLVMLLFVRGFADVILGAYRLTVWGLFLEIVVGAVAFVLLSIGYCIVTRNQYFKRLMRR